MIDGPVWFIGALVICGLHMCLLWGGRRERRAHHAWWVKYEADARARHDELMAALQPSGPAADYWALGDNRESKYPQ